MVSDFDQYGDTEASGSHPEFQRQLSKFASVQDRLREWKPEVMQKIQVFSCLAIKALDIDAIRIDKAAQVTVDALASWASHTRACAAKLGKTNFFIPGEITVANTFGSLYVYVFEPFFHYRFQSCFAVAVEEPPHSFLLISWQQQTSLQVKMNISSEKYPSTLLMALLSITPSIEHCLGSSEWMATSNCLTTSTSTL
jgi:hypothetical protein